VQSRRSTSQPTMQIFSNFSTTAFRRVQLILRSCGAALSTNPACHPAAHHANFSAAFSTSAFSKLQLILRCCLSSQGVAGFAPTPNFSRSTSQPTVQIFQQFFGDAFCKVQLILRSCGCGVGGVAGFAPNSN